MLHRCLCPTDFDTHTTSVCGRAAPALQRLTGTCRAFLSSMLTKATNWLELEHIIRSCYIHT